MEAIRTYKTNPQLTIATYSIPTWTMPLILILVVTALVPGTSLLGHLCGVLVGYLYQKTYGRFGVLPSSSHTGGGSAPIALVGTTQRLGP
ncbi:rhomboid protein 2 [Colletotrichum tofieldiae]|nr:rhomboid protein 2 [Colletotrichum tofieldiae]